MSTTLKPVLSQPGVYRLSGAPETSPGSGIYAVSDGVETSPGSGIYSLPVGDAFTVTVTADPPAAHMVFDGEDLPSGTHTIVVTRSWDDLSATVRSAWSLFADGGAVLDDWEIPTGVPVTYEAEAFAPDGTSLGKTAGVTVQINSEPSTGWISDPTNPNLVVQVILKGDFADELTTVRQVQTYQVGDRVVALLGALGKLENLNIRVQTATVADGKMLQQILQQSSVLIRTNPPADVPRLLYVVVPQVTKTGSGLGLNGISLGGGAAIWQGVGTEVSTTTLDILVPVVTWQTYIDAFPDATWDDVMAIYDGSWFDAIKNPPGA